MKPENPFEFVAIAIITCRRPDGLDKLLAAIGEMELPRFPDTEVRVFVVENGEKLESEAVVDKHRALGMDVTYGHEPKAGIPFARNAVMKMALAASDYFAFLDDDEFPPKQWLDEILYAALTLNAAVVRSPVLPVLPDDAPDWANSGGFYLRERYPTGSVIPYGASNNILLKCSIVRDAGVLFDERFAFTGGSDTLFFLELKRTSGVEVVWCDEAFVYEDIPMKRISPEWISMRARREGANLPQFDAAMGRGGLYKFRWACRGAVHVLLAVIQRAVAITGPSVSKIKALQRYHLEIGRAHV